MADVDPADPGAPGHDDAARGSADHGRLDLSLQQVDVGYPGMRPDAVAAGQGETGTRPREHLPGRRRHQGVLHRPERAAGAPAVTFAAFKLPVPAAVVAGKPGPGQFFGKKVILRVRPPDFEDGAFADASWPRVNVTAGVTEGLGTEVHAIFTIDAPPTGHASVTSASGGHDEEDETVAALIGGKSLWTARVSSRSAVRPGAPLELAVDTSRLHFFDPASAESVGLSP
jgi:hypothetical protein